MYFPSSTNRTIVELKQPRCRLLRLRGVSTNRTIVELKHRCRGYRGFHEDTTNRTIVELKLEFSNKLLVSFEGY